MKAYVIANIDVQNPTRYADYVKLTPGTIAPFGGRFIARGGRSEKLEGETAANRIVDTRIPELRAGEGLVRLRGLPRGDGDPAERLDRQPDTGGGHAVSARRASGTLAALAGLVVLALPAGSHDDTRGARYVGPEGANATDCLEHHDPCLSIQYALEQAGPGNTIKVAAGVYDVTGLDPERFLFGANHAQGGYEPGGHFEEWDPDAYPTILVGVDRKYRLQMMHLGFKWAADLASAQLGIVDDSPADALQATARRGRRLRPGVGRPVPVPQRRFPRADPAQRVHEPAVVGGQRLGLRGPERQ